VGFIKEFDMKKHFLISLAIIILAIVCKGEVAEGKLGMVSSAHPIAIHYRGYNVYTASPPSTAFPSLIRLGIMSRFDVKKLGHQIRVLKGPGGLTNAHGLTIEYDKEGKPVRFTGASDPRGRGLAQGL
jgi:gamma-glutamyltranspeptidase